MRSAVAVATLLAIVGLSGCIGDGTLNVDSDGDGYSDQAELEQGTDPQDPLSYPGVTPYRFGDVTVLAIVDSSFNPYHWDFLAAHMPQHMDNDTSNDLPLDQPPHTWIPGFPNPEEAFTGYQALDLTLTPDDPEADPSCVWDEGGDVYVGIPPGTTEPTECQYEEGGLYQVDRDEWDTVNRSNSEETFYHYIPGTKIIGYVNYAAGSGFSSSSHGVGTTSVSVGNYHGSCPECLLVFVNSYHNAANPWMSNQAWIDVQSNSWGRSTAYRENVYTACDLEPLQAGVERGQQIFWSAGNGQANAFVAPVNTLNSCQKGPDFLVTVGAISPDNEGSYTGHGKPVDVASFGRGYPSAGGSTVFANSTFSGTSNAAPVSAGLYAKALWTLRNELNSPRIQEDGVIATGPAGCGEANPDCPLADGQVTVHELREAFFRAATPSEATFTSSTLGLTDDPELMVGNQETEYLTEGHGSFRAHLGDINAEIASIVAEVRGDQFDAPDQDLLDYMAAYSYCSQEVWGHWEHGYWVNGDPLPTADPEKPIQSWMLTACPDMMNALLEPSRVLDEA